MMSDVVIPEDIYELLYFPTAIDNGMKKKATVLWHLKINNATSFASWNFKWPDQRMHWACWPEFMLPDSSYSVKGIQIEMV